MSILKALCRPSLIVCAYAGRKGTSELAPRRSSNHNRLMEQWRQSFITGWEPIESLRGAGLAAVLAAALWLDIVLLKWLL